VVNKDGDRLLQIKHEPSKVDLLGEQWAKLVSANSSLCVGLLWGLTWSAEAVGVVVSGFVISCGGVACRVLWLF